MVILSIQKESVFAVSRSLGLTAQAVMNKALMKPIIRPKSVTTNFIKELLGC
jgi:citrate synthase